jgi:hypothetical protein
MENVTFRATRASFAFPVPVFSFRFHSAFLFGSGAVVETCMTIGTEELPPTLRVASLK